MPISENSSSDPRVLTLATALLESGEGKGSYLGSGTAKSNPAKAIKRTKAKCFFIAGDCRTHRPNKPLKLAREKRWTTRYAPKSSLEPSSANHIDAAVNLDDRPPNDDPPCVVLVVVVGPPLMNVGPAAVLLGLARRQTAIAP